MHQPEKINPYQTPLEAPFGPSDQNLARKRRVPISWLTTIVVGLLVPGLAYWLILRNHRGMIGFLALFLAIPLAFVFFGPIWDLVLFDGTPYDQAGLYPFLGCCVVVPLASLLIAVRAKSRLELVVVE